MKADLKEQLREVINNLLDVDEQPYSTVVDMCVKILLEFRSKSDPQHRLHDVDGYKFKMWLDEDGGLHVGRPL